MDHYFCKKLAYNYINALSSLSALCLTNRRDDKSFCMVNDLTHDVSVDCEITEVYGGKKICSSKITVLADSAAAAAECNYGKR